ncbi:hypothetical protein GBAR_LOCUS19891 [Geodia barretti]|uniref:Uncharacterized protein n=1 Tax=Geodia barretti TaxID=519541 RepID=A0AA35SVE0_GEOBA|nr:hypothetical protein GBAR_LOCUS19891 [Geodia barretti]
MWGPKITPQGTTSPLLHNNHLLHNINNSPAPRWRRTPSQHTDQLPSLRTRHLPLQGTNTLPDPLRGATTPNSITAPQPTLSYSGILPLLPWFRSHLLSNASLSDASKENIALSKKFSVLNTALFFVANSTCHQYYNHPVSVSICGFIYIWSLYYCYRLCLHIFHRLKLYKHFGLSFLMYAMSFFHRDDNLAAGEVSSCPWSLQVHMSLNWHSSISTPTRCRRLALAGSPPSTPVCSSARPSSTVHRTPRCPSRVTRRSPGVRSAPSALPQVAVRVLQCAPGCNLQLDQMSVPPRTLSENCLTLQ